MAVPELYTARQTGCGAQIISGSVALLPRRVEEINNGWHSTEAKSAEQALRSGDVEALINIWENDSYSHYRQEKSVWNLYLLAQLPREMALTFWLRINEKKHLFAGEDYFLSILGLDTLPACYWLFHIIQNKHFR